MLLILSDHNKILWLNSLLISENCSLNNYCETEPNLSFVCVCAHWSMFLNRKWKSLFNQMIVLYLKSVDAQLHLTFACTGLEINTQGIMFSREP